MAGLIYLASPYTHNSAAVREARYFAVRSYTIQGLQRGLSIFSPIVYGRDMETQMGTDYKSWQTFNDAMLEACNSVWVLTISGWQDSRGVEHELRKATALGKTIVYADSNELPHANH